MKGYFIERQFPTTLIDACIERALQNSSQPKLPPLVEPIPLILTYDPSFPQETQELRTNSTWLSQDEIGKTPLKEYRPMICYRRPMNLKDLLVRADVKPPTKKPTGNKCCNKRCYNCRRMIVCKTVQSTSNNYEFKVRGNLDCNTHYVIYLIQCSQCNI